MSNEEKSHDVLVLGAGIVGVSTALHLQAAGQSVVLVDRREPGEEASHGNAGVIEKDGMIPLTIPSNPIEVAKYASNRQIHMHYHPTFMPRLAPWLFRMWLLSNDKGIDTYARAIAPLRAVAADEHAHFANEAGINEQFRATGWIHLYHSAKSFASTEGARRYAAEFGVDYEVVKQTDLEELEPHMQFDKDDHAIFWKGCVSVSSPKTVTKAYAALYESRGGRFVKGDARSLKREGDAWVVTTEAGDVKANKVVVSLGAWSLDLLKPMGYSFPLAAKRGYHQHFASKDGAFLNRPVVDEDVGFLMTPTEAGIRMTSGIEFAARDTKKTPVQIYRATEWARHLYPLGAPVEDEPWMGFRPCFPDSLPLIDRADNHPGLYFNFGHGHLGFATGPVTGRMMADMIMGRELSYDVKGFSAGRF
ncbi:D-amino-acid dehydrogenase [Cohaesibacter sp. ES.047]|uniref:NAD(P)/FAD-dependent oxidoreductase n=1 Tax=Cohaesibacter sp. ES.047 TaxID=1798205 RepID=UPI000BB77C8E|nr:FAD-binding oxidoreductase [Cohaesibacter sp. ES.047]SNY94214.1 D-amino-acid dehydrogenase [Cohaesibacter sp. ES.047]